MNNSELTSEQIAELVKRLQTHKAQNGKGLMMQWDCEMCGQALALINQLTEQNFTLHDVAGNYMQILVNLQAKIDAHDKIWGGTMYSIDAAELKGEGDE